MDPKEWLESIIELESDRCLEPPFSISTVYWRRQPMSLAKVVCGEKNGWDVDLQLVPVRTCQTKGCANGAHYHWGSRSEAQKAKATKRDHAGSRNPNAKLSWEAAQDIRARVAAVPPTPVPDILKGVRWKRTGISAAEVEVRRELAAKYGVSMRTIANVVEHRIWKEAEVDVEEKKPEVEKPDQRPKPRQYDFDYMAPGDSFSVSLGERKNVATAASRYGKKTGKKFSVKMAQGGLFCTRIY